MVGHSHQSPYTIPDYRIYKVSDVPTLVQLQKALAAKGLKDPWIRNEVWRFDEKVYKPLRWRVLMCLFRGWHVGLGMFAFHVAGNIIYDRVFPDCTRKMW
ncbi:unnamed protein product [Ceutorhynchus assimilis]|uniref:NADH dehydrogenase [ubiquinone] 1 beta subcomplex subunit 3 n=1 Tax=Ceutorhynchus assimilis TaxID=467358 RepID=A0A9N9QGY0_9CUCU|nr:unnamed protein product [Ceutorhynchus assimilis]